MVRGTPFLAVSPVMRLKLSVRCAVDRLGNALAVGIVAVGDAAAALAHRRQLAAVLPGIGPCAVGQGIAYGVVGDGLPIERRQQVRPISVAAGIGAACCPDVTVSRGKESEGRKRDSGQHPGRFTLFCRNTFQCGILLVLLMLIPGVYFSSPRYANCGSVSSANLIMYRDRIPTLSASAVSSSIYSMAKRYLSWVVSTS